MNVGIMNLRLRQQSSLAARGGFTLVEIMIVVLIIGLLAMIAVPNVKRNLEQGRLTAIQVNLRTIDNVKTQWSAENRKGGDAVPTEQDLAPYFQGNRFPTPVMGEVYNINMVDVPPTATISSRLMEYPAGSTLTMDGE
jgi:prepilin-type N-terminal cleavage/methylation domain-containing protein